MKMAEKEVIKTRMAEGQPSRGSMAKKSSKKRKAGGQPSGEKRCKIIRKRAKSRDA